MILSPLIGCRYGQTVFVRERSKKPIDKKSNYVKVRWNSGDTLEIFNGELRINGDKSILPYRAKPLFKYIAYNSKEYLAKNLINWASMIFKENLD